MTLSKTKNSLANKLNNEETLEIAIEKAKFVFQYREQLNFYQFASAAIKAERKKKRLSYAELSRRSGIDENTWQAYENNDEYPNLFEFVLMCQALGLSINFNDYDFGEPEQAYEA